MNEEKDGAQLMAELGELAAQAAHEVIGKVIDASDLSNHRKIGAAITAITALYAGLLEGQAKDGAAHRDKLVIGLFNCHCSEPLVKIALRMKAREENQ